MSTYVIEVKDAKIRWAVRKEDVAAMKTIPAGEIVRYPWVERRHEDTIENGFHGSVERKERARMDKEYAEFVRSMCNERGKALFFQMREDNGKKEVLNKFIEFLNRAISTSSHQAEIEWVEDENKISNLI